MIKDFLKQIDENQNAILRLLNKKMTLTLNDEEILCFFSEMKNLGFISNSTLIKKVADYLQLLNEEKYYSQFSLEEIGDIYLKLISMQPFDFSIIESAYWYFNAVLDNQEKAEEIFKNGIKRIEDRINDFKKESHYKL